MKNLGLWVLPAIFGPALWAQSNTSPATFHAQTKLVLVPFNVARGKAFVPDLKSSDVVLLEDGKPRNFTVFEGPSTRSGLPLELVLLFDTTTLLKSQKQTHWNRKATYDFTQHWDVARSRAILEQSGADVRVSIYHFDQNQLERLSRATKDPQEFLSAFRRLLSPISGPSTISLALPANRQILGPKDIPFSPGWVMEASIATMKDSVAAPENAMRMLVIFSEGKGGTTTTPEDVAERARTFGMPLFNVVFDFDQSVPPTLPGRDLAIAARDDLMRYFQNLADSTGGGMFYPSHINAKVISGILEFVRNRGLTQYVVGFVPESSMQTEHNLEIRLKSKSIGTLLGGQRKTVY
jgi:VWFA-related protein